MGSFFADTLSFDHSVAVLDNDPKKLRYLYNTERMSRPEEVAAFDPDAVQPARSPSSHAPRPHLF